MPRIAPRHTANARALRNAATAFERALWLRLRSYRPRFTRQLPVAGYIIDLACREARLAIELDGSQHHDQIEYDDARTAVLERLGWQVVRVWNNDVATNLDGVAEHILNLIARRTGTHPRPLPCREGRRLPLPNPLPQAGEGQEGISP